MDIEAIRRNLTARSGVIGREIVFYDITSSTNLEVLRLASEGYPEGTVVIADGQTAGKGRRGRTWLSPAGKNLYMSILLTPRMRLKEAAVLTIMTSAACVSALAESTALPVSIKWPNDIMVSERKLGGILTEAGAGGEGICRFVIGIGINVNWDLAELPEEIRAASASILNETGKKASRTEIAAAILKEMDGWYATLLAGGPRPVVEAWRELSSTLGREVRVTMEDTAVQGTAEGMDEEGRLLLRRTDGNLERISAGDVVHLRNSQELEGL